MSPKGGKQTLLGGWSLEARHRHSVPKLERMHHRPIAIFCVDALSEVDDAFQNIGRNDVTGGTEDAAGQVSDCWKNMSLLIEQVIVAVAEV